LSEIARRYRQALAVMSHVTRATRAIRTSHPSQETAAGTGLPAIHGSAPDSVLDPNEGRGPRPLSTDETTARFNRLQAGRAAARISVSAPRWPRWRQRWRSPGFWPVSRRWPQPPRPGAG